MNKQGNLIKEMNLRKIRSVLRENDIATKPQLAEMTGLSVVTINSLIKTLLAEGEVSLDAAMPTSGGRPAASFRYNRNFRLALMVYMHEHNKQDVAFYGVVNLRGEVIKRKEQVLSEVYVDSFDSCIKELLDQYPQIQAICFGIPGAEVDHELVIIDYSNMKGQSLSNHIETQFSLPVRVENNINAAVMGFCQLHQLSNDQCVVGLYFPDKYPPGAGIFLNGHIHKGSKGLAGEIKYLPFGIDWDNFQYDSADMQAMMIKTVQSFLCMYNPDRIVLYGSDIRLGIPELIRESSKSPVEKMLIPELITSADLNTGFEIGIKYIALSMIENNLLDDSERV